jgi:hypothetical protein
LLDLADALLDFRSADDLEGWLTTHAPPDQAHMQPFKRLNGCTFNHSNERAQSRKGCQEP